MANDVVSYASRDYQTTLDNINSDPTLAEHPEHFKRMVAGMQDSHSNTLDAVVNAILVPTMYSRVHAQDVLELIDYEMAWKTRSSVILTVNVDASATASGSYTVLAANIKAANTATADREAIQFEAESDLVFTISTTQSSIVVYSQKAVASQIVDQTNSVDFQRVDLPDLDVIKSTMVVVIGGNTYTQVREFHNSGPTDKHYKFYHRTDGSSFIELPGSSHNGTAYGVKPSSSLDINVAYSIGGGSDTIVNAATITNYLGADANVTSVTNSLASSGGKDEEPISIAKRLAPMLIGSNDMFWNTASGEALAEKIDGVLMAFIGKTGTLSCNIYVYPDGGGLPSTALKLAVKTELEAKSYMESAAVTALDPQYQDFAGICTVTVASGFTFSQLQKYVELAIVIRSSILTRYVKELFNSPDSGISGAITEINNSWGSLLTETYTLSDDGAQITRLLENVTTQTFGEDLQVNDLVNATGFVNGVDYVAFSSPARPTLTVASGYISNPTSVTVTEA